jgi:hypothetical protein
MIRVTVELVPLGNEKKAEKISQFSIFNDGKISLINGDPPNNNIYYYQYVGWLLPPGASEIEHFDSDGVKHERSNDVLVLVSKVLNDYRGMND